ncbi:mechanosensitive ion channel family protein [Candidatus Peregrinibacteria bacterium]|nr:mechanosensitive ion channel family protein [Candidatus Peregrinibacteria bacterium]
MVSHEHLAALGAFAALFALFLGLRHILLNHCALLVTRTKFRFDDLLLCSIGKVQVWFCFFLAFFLAVHHLDMPIGVRAALRALLLISVTVQSIFIAEGIIAELIDRFIDRDGKPGIPRVLSVLLRITLWSVGILLILGNLGINITSLLAGLGIGGIAMSLALQSVIADLFSAFSIAVDKPFEEGDYVVIGAHRGYIRRIGLKSTRIESLQGEEVIVSNNELVTTRVQNFKRLQHRRTEFNLSLRYDTPPEKLQKVRTMIRNIIDSDKEADFDRANVRTFGDSGLRCEVVYFAKHNNYNQAVNIQERITIEILRKLKEEGIGLAFPTMTVELEKA